MPNPPVPDRTWMMDDQSAPQADDTMSPSDDNDSAEEDVAAPSPRKHPFFKRKGVSAPTGPVAFPRRPSFVDPDRPVQKVANMQLSQGTRKRDRDITR